MTKFNHDHCQLVLVESDLGGAVAGAAAGPEHIRQWLSPDLNMWQRLKPGPLSWHEAWPNARRIEVIQPLLSELHHSVRQFFLSNSQQKMLLVTGDHSSACAAIGGLKAAFPEKRLGVIWIDAHADIHSPASTPSGNLHGMPLGAVLSSEPVQTDIPLWQATQALCAGSIKADDLVYIGIRDLEEAEWELLERRQICAFTATEVRMTGAAVIAQKALRHLSELDLLYVSFDIDALDASIATATGTPVVAGLQETEVRTLLQIFLADPRAQLFEISEFAPVLDQQGQTAAVLQRLLTAVIPELMGAMMPTES
jgi:arginase